MTHGHQQGDDGSWSWCCPDFTTLPCTDPHCDLALVCSYPSSPSSRTQHPVSLPTAATTSAATTDWFDGAICCEDVSCAPAPVSQTSTPGPSTSHPTTGTSSTSEDATTLEGGDQDDCACCAAGCPSDPKETECPGCGDSADVFDEAAIQELLKCCCCGDETSPSSFSTHHLTTHPTHDLGSALPSFLFPPAISLPPSSTSFDSTYAATSVSLESTPALTGPSRAPWSTLNHPTATSPPFALASPIPISVSHANSSLSHPRRHPSTSKKGRHSKRSVKPLPPPTSRLLPCEWAGCQGYFPSREALVAHVNSAHLAATNSDPAGLEEGGGEDESEDDDEGIEEGSSGHPAELPNPGKRPRTSTTSALTPSPTTTTSTGGDGLGEGEHRCRWTGCRETFTSTADLTAHLSERHVGSGKGLYVCEWEGCRAPACSGASGNKSSAGTAAKGKRRRVGDAETDDEDEEDGEEGGTGGRRRFAQRQKIMRHLQVHTGDRPFVCETCGRAFGEMATLVQHRRVHTHEKPFECDFPGCGKSFAIASALTIHRRTHSGAKPFPCPFPGCAAAFAESSNLTKHLRVHTGERPFVCERERCGKAFKRSDQLARHRKVHA